jgi:hypothetical protein
MYAGLYKEDYDGPSRGDKKCIPIFDEETSYEAATLETGRPLRRIDRMEIGLESRRWMKIAKVICKSSLLF